MGRKKKKSSFADYEKSDEWLRRVTETAMRQRSSHMSFHGLEEELHDLQVAILASYRKSKTIKHPRDMGDEREEILRHFLTSSGLLPTSVGVAKTSTRVVAPSGHISPELDILLFEAHRAIVLKRLKKVEFYPIESVHGTIQVKSKLTRKALKEGLDNIALFKGLNPEVALSQDIGGLTVGTGLHRRFGVLFAYEYDLDWMDVVGEVKKHVAKVPAQLWPNLIVILDRGLIFLGSEHEVKWRSGDLLRLDPPIVHGRPSQPENALLNFYSVLFDLIKTSTAGTPDLTTYLRMPLTAGALSYRFSFGPFSEVEKCPEHGDYLRRFTEVSLQKVIDESARSAPINWVRALQLALGQAGGDVAAYARQPTEVRIYNPDGRPLRQILADEKGNLTHDTIETSEMICLVPWVYIIEHKLIEGCPKCSRASRRKKHERMSE